MTQIVQVKVTLKGVRPPIWRRLEMDAAASLAEVHDAIQWAMGWHDCHLHLFVVGKERYGRPHPDDPEPVNPEAKLKLSQLLRRGIKKFLYVYDFGDDWTHEVLLEKTVKPAESAAYPRCVAGRRACPPEDCGGPPGYAALLEAGGKPGFDPERFDKAAVNRRLAPMAKASAPKPAKPATVSDVAP